MFNPQHSHGICGDDTTPLRRLETLQRQPLAQNSKQAPPARKEAQHPPEPRAQILCFDQLPLRLNVYAHSDGSIVTSPAKDCVDAKKWETQEFRRTHDVFEVKINPIHPSSRAFSYQRSLICRLRSPFFHVVSTSEQILTQCVSRLL